MGSVARRRPTGVPCQNRRERDLIRTCRSSLTTVAGVLAVWGLPAQAPLAQSTPVAQPAPLAQSAQPVPSAQPEQRAQPAELIPSDAQLEASGAVIGEILIDNQNIFNLADAREDTRIFRLANRIHIKTRARVVSRQLLFRKGDRFSRHVLDESERVLRADRYFYDARIEAVRYRDGVVDVRVTTRDVWTLNPGISFGRSGGQNTSGFELEELNVLGTGAEVSVGHKSGIDRTENNLSVADQHAFGTWTSVAAQYSDNSDGSVRQLIVDKPFYALDVRRAGGATLSDVEQVDSLYDRGQIVDKFRDRAQYLQGYVGFSGGLQNGWVERWRFGATYDERSFGMTPAWTGVTVLPEDRKYVYPWAQFDLIQDDFQKLHNHDQIERTEDFFLGTFASLRLGWADSALGSSRSALMFQSYAGQGAQTVARTTLLFSEQLTGRLENGVLRNAVLEGTARYYTELSSKWLFFSSLEAAAGRNLDLENQLLLGGDNGLRGYPLRYQGGDARALLTLEERYYTDWYPFRLFRIGGAVFFDAGRTWGPAPLTSPNLGLLKDAGFGLRIGNSRSGLGNVIHVDVAFPMDGDTSIKRVQFVVQTKQSF